MIIQEMADLLALDLVDKRLVTDQIVLTVGYDIENLSDPAVRKAYKGPVTTDRYGRRIPKHAHGTIHLVSQTSSAHQIIDAALELYDRIVDKKLLIRRASISAEHVLGKETVKENVSYEQLDLFTDYGALQQQKMEEERDLERERKMQKAVLEIKKRFGKNMILKGMNLEEGARSKDRNERIGGHKA